ncbi:MAG: MarR family winged helix-turn-helix transcriptional regulator [Thermodesulfobacteriota bacterium]
MKPSNEVVINDIVIRIRRLRRSVYHDYIRTSRQFGLTETQSDVLRTLLTHGTMSSADLSRNLYVTPANITGVIDRLEKKGLVQRVRQQADRRVALISLTETGKDLSKQLPDPIENKLISGLENLAPEQVQALGEAMKKIIDLIGDDRIKDLPLGSDSEPRG